MNAVIGTEDDIIGFGLTGIEQRIVLNGGTTKKDVESAIESLHEDTKTCFIQEKLVDLHTPKRDGIRFITIPDKAASPEINKILDIARKTLGIKLE